MQMALVLPVIPAEQALCRGWPKRGDPPAALRWKLMQNRPTNRLAGVAIALVALVALLGVTYRYGVHPDLLPKNFSVVDPGKIYRSGELTPASTERVVRERGIKTIIDLGAYDKDPIGEMLAFRTAKALSVDRRVFRLEGDGRGNPQAYVEALRIMTDPASQPVLVHCSAGAQRTSACVLLYREIVQGWTRDRAMPEAFAHDHNPRKNPYLTPYLDDHEREIAEALRAGPEALIPGREKAEVRSPAAGPE